MATYDYEAEKNRINAILNNSNDIDNVEAIPNDQEFTYENSYPGWVSAIFVDIRDARCFLAMCRIKGNIYTGKRNEIMRVYQEYIETSRLLGNKGDFCAFSRYDDEITVVCEEGSVVENFCRLFNIRHTNKYTV